MGIGTVGYDALLENGIEPRAQREEAPPPALVPFRPGGSRDLPRQVRVSSLLTVYCSGQWRTRSLCASPSSTRCAHCRSTILAKIRTPRWSRCRRSLQANRKVRKPGTLLEGEVARRDVSYTPKPARLPTRLCGILSAPDGRIAQHGCSATHTKRERERYIYIYI